MDRRRLSVNLKEVKTQGAEAERKSVETCCNLRRRKVEFEGWILLRTLGKKVATK